MRGMYDWTSLTRSQNLKVFERLPDKLVELLPDEDAAQLSTLWKVQAPVNNDKSTQRYIKIYIQLLQALAMLNICTFSPGKEVGERLHCPRAI